VCNFVKPRGRLSFNKEPKGALGGRWKESITRSTTLLFYEGVSACSR
jgi:hypothetical protein